MALTHWCHACDIRVAINENIECIRCQGGFVEERSVIQEEEELVDPVELTLIIRVMMMYMVQEDVANGSFENTSTEKIAASSSFIESLSSLILSDTEVNKDCSICYENFKQELRGIKLPCGHIFHERCIKKWLEIDHICPTCRHELPCQSSDDE